MYRLRIVTAALLSRTTIVCPNYPKSLFAMYLGMKLKND